MSETDFTDFPWKEAQQLVDAWMEGKHERPLNGGDVSDLETRIRSALASTEQETRAELGKALTDIADERKRQVEQEGWSADHDDAHYNGELAEAGGCYALYGSHEAHGDFSEKPPVEWPWDWGWWKPKDRRRDLVRAAALIVAEIERLDRLSQADAIERDFSEGRGG